MSTIQGTQRLVVDDCCSCGVQFAWPEDLRRYRLDNRRDGTRNTFYCPNGHAQHFTGKTDADQLRARLDRANAQLTHERDQKQTAERRAAAARGQVTKIRRRVAKGVCPGCGRTFPNLAAHMETKHPGFVEGDS